MQERGKGCVCISNTQTPNQYPNSKEEESSKAFLKHCVANLVWQGCKQSKSRSKSSFPSPQWSIIISVSLNPPWCQPWMLCKGSLRTPSAAVEALKPTLSFLPSLPPLRGSLPSHTPSQGVICPILCPPRGKKGFHVPPCPLYPLPLSFSSGWHM